MRLILVRHGESVDNVAGLYAGSRDSPLTNHGILQARRLGTYLAVRASTIGPVKHIFVSNLQRAVKTAEAIAEGQAKAGNNVGPVERFPELREKDFGSDEGMRFGARRASAGYVASSTHIPPETREAMMVRIDRFIDQRLVPCLVRAASKSAGSVEPCSVVVVAHGIILNVLLRSLLSRFGPEELTRLARPSDSSSTSRSESLASWSNTGYLEAEVRVIRALATYVPAGPKHGQPSNSPAITSPASFSPTAPAMSYTIKMSVNTVNSVEHLQGLKKTRGGIGSAKFDDKQKTVDSFFTSTAKKRKPSEDAQD